jgi:transposase-like protein
METQTVRIRPHCPQCGSDALNNYGYDRKGKQRYICLVCNRQFVLRNARRCPTRPECPLCHAKMHIYKHENRPNDRSVRFRCSNYPRCRGYTKIDDGRSPTALSAHPDFGKERPYSPQRAR